MDKYEKSNDESRFVRDSDLAKEVQEEMPTVPVADAVLPGVASTIRTLEGSGSVGDYLWNIRTPREVLITQSPEWRRYNGPFKR